MMDIEDFRESCSLIGILFLKWRKGAIKENGGGGEFKYDIFDILYEPL
jgi:hypothetical protein